MTLSNRTPCTFKEKVAAVGKMKGETDLSPLKLYSTFCLAKTATGPMTFLMATNNLKIHI